MRLVCQKWRTSDLDNLSSKELHDRAFAEASGTWTSASSGSCSRSLPAAEAAIGEEDEAEPDVMTLRGRLNDLTHSGEGELADACARSTSTTC